jgi:endonuclease/exonuclease/phosphatase family metal-dependent hydrolase
MRIVSYNILDGGEGRADPLAEVIEAQRPDVVALVESTDLSVVERIAKRLNMDYVRAPGKPGSASTLLSRYPIRDSVNHGAVRPELTKSLLDATIRTPEFGDLGVGVVHLHAGAYEQDERTREREAAAILDVFSPHRVAHRPHVLVGDFNANSPTQQIDPTRAHAKTRAAYEANGGSIPRRVIQLLLNQGYVDTLRAASGLAADSTLNTFTTKDPGQRVDYIFTHSVDPSRIKGAWVEHDRLATYASDHYPTCAELI